MPKLYPPWFKPELIELDEQFDAFKKAKYLTKSKDIILIETPGHTYHHSSVLIKTDECFIFFAADICYSQQQLLMEKFPGNNASNKLAKETFKAVKLFAENNPVVLIPSHDGTAGERLKSLLTLDQQA